MNDALQVIVTVLGIVSQLLLLGKEFYAQEKGAAPAPQYHPALLWRTRSFLDLSFVLICAAFLSLLLTDSLLIAGRNPSPGTGTILTVFLITSVVVVTMCAAWFLKLTELVTGVLSVTTLIVLIMSRGGPFFASGGDGAVPETSDDLAGWFLFVSTVSLVTLASTMFIYWFGNPLSRAIPKRKRMIVSLTLLGLTLISAGALGKQLVKDVENNELSPKVKSAGAKALIQQVMRGGIQERRNFYQLASEVALAGVYQKYYHTVSQDQQALLEKDLGAEAPAGPRPKPTAPGATKAGNNGAQGGTGGGEPAAGAAGSPPAEQKDTPAWLTDQREKMRGLIEDAMREGNYQRAMILEDAFAKLGTTREILKEQGIGRLSFLVSYFEASDVTAKERYMLDRFNWVHPVGLENQSEAVIPLPGATSEQRFDNTSSRRIFKALYGQTNLRQKILKEFEYPEDVSGFFREKDQPLGPRGSMNRSETSGLEEMAKLALFPKFDTTIGSTRLQEQLSLPRKEEAYVAYKEYKLLASLLLKQDLRGKIEESQLDALADTFNRLDDAAQDAFRNYVINNKKMPSEKVYQTLLALKDVNFGPLADSQDPLAVEKLSSMLSGKRLSNSPELQGLADEIESKVEGRDAKDALGELLKNEGPEVPIKRLFQRPVFDLVSQMHRALGSDKKVFFDAVADPVWLVVKHYARVHDQQNADRPAAAQFPLDNYIEQFRDYRDDQQGILLQLAISLYQPGGQYSLDPIRLLISQVNSWDGSVALLCASLLSLPALLLSIIAGGFFARRLFARDRLRELISGELEGARELDSTLGSPVEMHGRDGAVKNLRSLAERGWSTIGVVGRRGVGKSRILYSLTHGAADEATSPTVKVWVSSPSKFQEEEFIHSIFERLALSTEGAVASYLGAKPLSIRKIESRTAQMGALFYGGVLIVLCVVVYLMYNRLTRSDIVITWLPILALVCTSVWLFFNHISKLQPVDLSSWLQRDRTHNSHTVMLYREIYDALNYLRRRVRQSVGEAGWPQWGLIRTLGLTLFGAIFMVSALLGMIGPRSLSAVGFFLAACALSAAAWIYLYKQGERPDGRGSTYGQSLMSLIADYRSFATTIVYRLGQGALGHRSERRFSVLICIDELDKIVDFEEIRAFVRRVKAIFEVPGVYYYVSLAEDTLTALYLGPAEGKNEIDSAFDHIVRIPPLTCAASEAVATEYLVAHGLGELHPKLTRALAAISYGIPRDIIRRCDELIARADAARVTPQQITRELRALQVDMGYELKHLSRAQMAGLKDNFRQAAWFARDALGNGVVGEAEQRLIFSAWLLSLLEAALERLGDERWREVTERICGVGYRLPVDSLQDLRSEMEGLHSLIFSPAEEAVREVRSPA